MVVEFFRFWKRLNTCTDYEIILKNLCTKCLIHICRMVKTVENSCIFLKLCKLVCCFNSCLHIFVTTTISTIRIILIYAWAHLNMYGPHGSTPSFCPNPPYTIIKFKCRSSFVISICGCATCVWQERRRQEARPVKPA